MEPTTSLDPSPAPAALAVPLDRSTGRFRLHRSGRDRLLGGVCGGLAESFGVDATLLRLVLVAITVLGFGAGVVLYAGAWILFPADPRPGQVGSDQQESTQQGSEQ